jgi:hypothetical protein
MSAQMGKPKTRQLVAKIYRRAIADEAEVMSWIWPSACEHIKKCSGRAGIPAKLRRVAKEFH